MQFICFYLPHPSIIDGITKMVNGENGKGDWLVVLELAGRLVFDYQDHQGTYCGGRADLYQAGSNSSDGTEDFSGQQVCESNTYLVVLLRHRV